MRTGATSGETVSDEAILEAVAAEAGWMEDLLVRLVEAPTTLGDEEAGQRIMEQAFADCGLEPRSVYLDTDTLRGAEGASPFSWDVKGKRNVVAGWIARGSGGRSLILNGHVDVVPPAAEALWTNPPFLAVRDGDWIYGRGAGDMKAGLAAMTGAVRALKSAGYDPAADVQLQSVLRRLRRRLRRMRAISFAWGYPLSASGRGERGSTASTSVSRCAPSSSPRRCSGSL
jgi:acetylornithine deacetylase